MDARSAAFGFACGLAAYPLYQRVKQLRTDDAAPGPVKESTIRLMTRIAMQSGAVNLSQGFPNEAPPTAMVCAAAGALLAGDSEAAAAAMAKRLEALAYYKRWYPTVAADADANVTVVMGATEGFAATIRADGARDAAFFEPFHELYPSQLAIFGLTPRAVTLTAGKDAWGFDESQLDASLAGAKLLLFNDPHNPTGHRFSDAERDAIARLCAKHDVVVVTDEIYEHMCFRGGPHATLAARPDCAGRAVVVNSISKTAKATGWRIGWVVASAARTAKIRAVHDQLVACCPTPLQHGVAALLDHPETDETVLAAIAGEYEAKRDALAAALARAGFGPGRRPRAPTLVTFGGVAAAGLSPTDAALKMTRDFKVACVPGDNFYLGASKATHGAKYLRFAFVRSLDVIADAAANLAKLPS
ncbi:transferase [Aureococcus anophagefferens]|nr:transferase [Aureococcus anophagefferens]